MTKRTVAKMHIRRENILEHAKTAVCDRQDQYGQPEDNFLKIAAFWIDWIDARYGKAIPFDAIDVAIMLDLLKTARLAGNPQHLDSWIDKAGYAACGGEVSGIDVD